LIFTSDEPTVLRNRASRENTHTVQRMRMEKSSEKVA